MATTFHGSLQELQGRLLFLNLQGDWEAHPNGVWKYRCTDKANLLWSETTGAVWFDGEPVARAVIQNKIQAILADEVPQAPIDEEPG